jgi:hypothetical protein
MWGTVRCPGCQRTRLTLLSITFAVFFAALAIIMSGSDNEFVYLLEQEGDYSHILSTMRFTLLVLFAALMLSIGLYAWAAIRFESKVIHQTRWFLALFSFLFFDGLMG